MERGNQRVESSGARNILRPRSLSIINISPTPTPPRPPLPHTHPVCLQPVLPHTAQCAVQLDEDVGVSAGPPHI